MYCASLWVKYMEKYFLSGNWSKLANMGGGYEMRLYIVTGVTDVFQSMWALWESGVTDVWHACGRHNVEVQLACVQSLCTCRRLCTGSLLTAPAVTDLVNK